MMISDCCGVMMVDGMEDMGLCPRCLEHCEVIFDDSDSEESNGGDE